MSGFRPEADISIIEKTPTTGEVEGALERRVANVVPLLILARRYLVELYKMDSRVTIQLLPFGRAKSFDTLNVSLQDRS